MGQFFNTVARQFSNLWSIIRSMRFVDVIDIIIVAVIIYYAYKFIKNRRASRLAVGVVLLLVVFIISDVVHMYALGFLLSNVFQVGLIALIILFQPELRAVLEKVGAQPLKGLKNISDSRASAETTSMIANVCEAVTDMYKTSYSHEIANDRVAIRKARRLISTSHKDTLGAKIAGGPVIPINLDIVKNRSYLLNLTHLSNYSFSMRPFPNTSDGRNAVIITIKPKIKAETALLMGDFYIDVSTLAIRHIELQLDMSDRENAIRFMLERKPFGVRFRPREFNITIDYRYDNAGRLFLGYIRTDISFKCDWKRKLFSSPYHVTSEMVVTDLKTENVKPVRGRQVFLSHESLYDHVEFFNDSTFWQQYNIIEPTESLEKGIERLLKKATL